MILDWLADPPVSILLCFLLYILTYYILPLYSNPLSCLLRAALLMLTLPWFMTLDSSPFIALTAKLFIG